VPVKKNSKKDRKGSQDELKMIYSSTKSKISDTCGLEELILKNYNRHIGKTGVEHHDSSSAVGQ
jgi:hypothetical protein